MPTLDEELLDIVEKERLRKAKFERVQREDRERYLSKNLQTTKKIAETLSSPTARRVIRKITRNERLGQIPGIRRIPLVAGLTSDTIDSIQEFNKEQAEDELASRKERRNQEGHGRFHKQLKGAELAGKLISPPESLATFAEKSHFMTKYPGLKHASVVGGLVEHTIGLATSKSKKKKRKHARGLIRTITFFFFPTVGLWYYLIIGMLIAVMVLTLFVTVTAYAACTGSPEILSLLPLGNVLSWTPLTGVALVSIYVCSQLGINVDLTTLPTVSQPTNAPNDLVTLIGLADVSPEASDPRARVCMANKVAELFNKSQAAGLSWVVTSGYRPGATTSTGVVSAHSRGEAVDIALVPSPSQPWSTNQKIRDLINLARSLGFRQPAGDTLDEYNDPNEKTSGGHIHIEYNLSSQGSFCDLAT